MDIADMVRRECIGLFADDDDLRASFGVSGKADAAMLLQLCAPTMHYSKRDAVYQVLPESFKTLISRPDRFNEDFGNRALYVFHHRFDIKRAARKLHEFAKAEAQLLEQLGAERFRNVMGRDVLDPDTFIDGLQKRYSDPSCIWMNVRECASFLAEHRTNNYVMDYLYQDRTKVFMLLEQFLQPEAIASVQRAKQRVTLYDFFRMPVEITHAEESG